MSLIIAAVCHDIDHSGLTNNFIRLKNDVLAQLYEDFCDENHRYEVTMYFVQVSYVLYFVLERSAIAYLNFKKKTLIC